MDATEQCPYCGRYDLSEQVRKWQNAANHLADALARWTGQPQPKELQDALAATEPKEQP